MKFSPEEFFRRLAQENASPHEVALGVAVGIFVSFSPFYGFQTLICIGILLLFRNLNRLAVLAGVQASWFYPPMLYLNYLAGRWIVPGSHAAFQLSDFREGDIAGVWELIKELFPLVLAGSIVAGGIAGICAYCAVWSIFRLKRRGVHE